METPIEKDYAKHSYYLYVIRTENRDGLQEHLKKNGIVVFLHVPFPEIRERVRDFATRGIARAPEQSFADLFEERYVLYKKYADVTIDCEGLHQEQVSEAIRGRLGPDG